MESESTALGRRATDAAPSSRTNRPLHDTAASAVRTRIDLLLCENLGRLRPKAQSCVRTWRD